jgi:argininosuccinate lyase
VSKPVWHSDKKGHARETFVAFSAGRDVVGLPMADSILVPYDIWTNQAHALTLHKAGVFSSPEIKKLIKALNTLYRRWERGDWFLNPDLEDVHINIESFISKTCGEEIGGRLHSGRSRNDQVANDMKLYARDVILAFHDEAGALVSSLIDHADKHLETAMPGYTHHRKATITTWAHICASYAQGLLRDAQRFMDIYGRINTCPLGAAASYGTTWPLDREYTAKLMAFDRVQENTLDAVMSRGEAEGEIIQAASLFLKRLSCIAQDLILFSTEEFGYLSLPSDFTTGSSIMPQKRNPDFAEAIKGKSQAVQGYANALCSINASNLSGYNKDVQWTKYQFMDAVRETQDAAAILADVFEGLEVHADTMRKAAESGYLNAVDIADYLAQSRNLPFRTTYHILSDAVGISDNGVFSLEGMNSLLEKKDLKPLTKAEFQKLSDPSACIKARDHTGSPHPKRVKQSLATFKKNHKTLQTWTAQQRKQIEDAKKLCTEI